MIIDGKGEDRYDDQEHSTKSIFLRAIKIDNLAEREAFVDAACGGDEERSARLVRLLHYAEEPEMGPLDRIIDRLRKAQPILDSSCSESVQIDDSGTHSNAHCSVPADWGEPDQLCGYSVGPYRLLRVLGQGGMGTVFLAEQEKPLHRRVALKVAHSLAGNREWAGHLQLELAALERLDHPGIARILDAGKTDWGAPFIVMELVLGEPITRFCRSHQLDRMGRLRLFVDVCRAVTHAHQKGLIHRDLKPSNVLVTERDGKPVTKVIDFGIATVIDGGGLTGLDQEQNWGILGTPSYISPEQASGGQQLIDTRTDIYSLGLILYELLTDRKPFESIRLHDLDRESLSSFLSRVTPVRPSQQTGITSRDAKSLRHELDWVVMKAIRKQPEQRYQTVAELEDEVSRVLSGQPIQARPWSLRYHGLKAVSYYRKSVVTLALVVLTLFFATLYSRRQAVQARQAREISDKLLFAADLKIATEALKDGNIRQARHRLERHLPSPGQTDRRNFAWQYLWGELNPELRLTSVEHGLMDVCFSPNGSELVTADAFGGLRVWDLNRDEYFQDLIGHEDTIRRLAFSPSGKLLASGSDDGQLRIWDTQHWKPLASLAAHERRLTDLVWLNDHQLATAGNREVCIWDFSKVAIEKAVEPVDQPADLQNSADSVEPELIQRLGPMPETAYALAVSPDGRRIACGSGSGLQLPGGLVREWEWTTAVQTGEALMESRPHCLAYHPDGLRLFAGCQNGELNVLDATRIANQLTLLDGHSSNVYRLVLTEDGGLLASASKDATIRIWNTSVPYQSHAYESRVIQSHSARVYSVDFSPDGNRLASASGDASWRLFSANRSSFEILHSTVPEVEDLPDPDLKHSVERNTESQLRFFWARFHPPSNTFALQDASGIIYQLSLNESVAIPMAVANDMSGIVSDQGFLAMSLIVDNNMSAGEESKLVEVDLDGDGSPDQVAGFGSNSNMIWRPGNQPDQPWRTTPLRSYHRRWAAAGKRIGSQPDHYYFNPDSGSLYYIYADGLPAWRCELLSSEMPKDLGLYLVSTVDSSIEKGSSHYGLWAASPSSGVIFFLPMGVNHGLVDWSQRVEINTGMSGFHTLHFTSATAQVPEAVLAAGVDGGLLALRLDQNGGWQELQRWQSPGEICELDEIDGVDGRYLYGAGPQGLFRFSWLGDRWEEIGQSCSSFDHREWCRPLRKPCVLYDYQKHQFSGRFTVFEENIAAMTVSPSGKLIAMAGHDGRVKIFSESGRLMRVMPELHHIVHNICISNDDSLICVNDLDDLLIYDMTTGHLINRCQGHDNSIKYLCISESSRMIASVSTDKTIRLWSLPEGQPRGVFVGHPGFPTKVCFSPDEKLLVSGDTEGCVKFWDVETQGELLELNDMQMSILDLAFESPEQLIATAGGEAFGNPPGYMIGRWSVPPLASTDTKSEEAEVTIVERLKAGLKNRFGFLRESKN